MLTADDERGRRTGCQAVSYALVLVPAGMLPAIIGLAGPVYSVGALLLGLFYLADAARFWFEPPGIHGPGDCFIRRSCTCRRS